MITVSLKSMRTKIIILVLVIIIAAMICIISGNRKPPQSEDATTGVCFEIQNSDDIDEFIKSTGLSVDKSTVEKKSVLIPEIFDETYKEYNKIQKQQGMDLSKYKGKTAELHTYTVTNYPEYEDSRSIRLNILVYDGKIIGGDVCNVALDGFMTTMIK